jgi:CRP-like cAMP-binding protein
VTAETDAVCLFLPREAFLDTIRDHPELLAELYETALAREEETSTILAREAESADDLVLL